MSAQPDLAMLGAEQEAEASRKRASSSLSHDAEAGESAAKRAKVESKEEEDEKALAHRIWDQMSGNAAPGAVLLSWAEIHELERQPNWPRVEAHRQARQQLYLQQKRQQQQSVATDPAAAAAAAAAPVAMPLPSAASAAQQQQLLSLNRRMLQDQHQQQRAAVDAQLKKLQDPAYYKQVEVEAQAFCDRAEEAFGRRQFKEVGQMADELINLHSYGRAIDLIKYDPRLFHAYRMRARALMETKFYKTAANNWEFVVHGNPYRPEFRHSLALCYGGMELYQKALVAMAAAIGFGHVPNADDYLLQARWYKEVRVYDKALACCDLVSGMCFPESGVIRGHILWCKHMPAEATVSWKQAAVRYLALHPRQPAFVESAKEALDLIRRASPLSVVYKGDRACVICTDREAVCLLVPCNHLCMCETCVWKIDPFWLIRDKSHLCPPIEALHSGCPMCRKPIEQIMRVYV